MATAEQNLLDLLGIKLAEKPETNENDAEPSEVEVYQDRDGLPPNPDQGRPQFSNVARESSNDLRYALPGRLLSGKAKADAAQREIIKNVLTTKNYETSSVQLQKSASRQPTLLEQTLKVVGRP